MNSDNNDKDPFEEIIEQMPEFNGGVVTPRGGWVKIPNNEDPNKSETTKNLFVILGAGASAGSTIGTSPTGWTPPVTKDIFDPQYFYDILRKYELSKGLTAGITQECKDGTTLEQYLKNSLGTQAKYKSLPDHRKRQLHELPAYLQELFSYISRHFGSATRYGRLVDLIFDKNINVTFLTLNYDLLLDQAIENSTGIKINQFGFYYANSSKWVLLKLHGSVNWFKRINQYTQSGNTFDSWKSIIHNMNLQEDLAQDITLLDLEKYDNGFVDNMPYYPALAIPNNDYTPIYPDSNFKTMLNNRLSQCNNFLFIGFSAYDDDLLNIFNQYVKKVDRLLLVGRNSTNNVAIYDRLIAKAPVFKKYNTEKVLYNDGFEGLVNISKSDLNDFLNSL